MRVTCPSCSDTVEIPDSESGRAVNCPTCGDAFQAPVVFDMPPPTPAAPPVVPPPPPPPLPLAEEEEPPPTTPMMPSPYTAATPPPPPEPAIPMPFPEPKPEPEQPAPPPPPRVSSGARERGISLDLKVIQWVPAACFGLIFLLTFMSWVGLYPAGYPAYTQNAWQAAFGSFSVGQVGGTPLESLETDLTEAVSSNWWLMLPYLLALILGLIVAAIGPLLPRVKRPLPTWSEKFIPYRQLLLVALTSATCLALLMQESIGLGLETGVKELAAEKVGEAETDTQLKRQIAEMNEDAVLAVFRLETTAWMKMAALLHFVALAAVGFELWLRRRGHREPPRVMVRW